MKTTRIVPIILAAGRADRLEFPQGLAVFGHKTAVEIALENCAGLSRPIVVLGAAAEEVLPAVPPHAQVVVNRRWRAGQLGSLLAALKRVPSDAAVLLYPVDHPLLNRRLIKRLVRAYMSRRASELIVMPRCGKRPGHPVIFAPQLRHELQVAKTAREVTHRDPQRVCFVRVKTKSIWEDFNSPASYRRLAKKHSEFHGQKRTRQVLKKL